jgi:tRNA 2-selenouridine synthase
MKHPGLRLERTDCSDYRGLFLAGAALLDTRAPIEFAKGAFPGAVNIPLMNDEERHLVGIRYKQAGQESAIALGRELVSGALRDERLAAWCDFARSHPDGFIYCFRGGLRSQTVRQWLRECGIEYPLVEGGYKAMRNFLLDEQERSLARARFTLIAGKTGTGKTRAITALSRAIDLEGLARHRGSSFGQLLEDQPSQIDFENQLSIEFMQLLAAGPRQVLLEDEGHLIGRIALTDQLQQHMGVAPVLLIEESLSNRLDVVVADYVEDLGRRYSAAYGPQASQLHEAKLLDDLGRIKRRLGDQRHRDICAQLTAGFATQRDGGSLEGHRLWIETLLLQYYDPMYDYQLSRREGSILARGTRAEIIEFAGELAASDS